MRGKNRFEALITLASFFTGGRPVVRMEYSGPGGKKSTLDLTEISDITNAAEMAAEALNARRRRATELTRENIVHRLITQRRRVKFRL